VSAPSGSRAGGPNASKIVGTAGVVVLALALGILAWPRAVGLHGTRGVLHLISVRGAVALALLVLAAILASLPWRRRLLPVTVVVGVAALAHVAVLTARGTSGLLTGSDVRGDLPDDAVVVLALNTHGEVPAEDVASLVVARGADVVVLPETLRDTAERVAALAAEAGRDFQVLVETTGNGVTGSTALLVDHRLGEYSVTEVLPGSLATFTAVPVDGSGPPITAAHPDPPVGRSLPRWSALATAATGQCATPSAIVAGDFNATLDHPAFDEMGECVDALAAAGAGGVGTWPASLPWALGAPIDHVLVDGADWQVVAAGVLEPPSGTDHRAVEAVLVRR